MSTLCFDQINLCYILQVFSRLRISSQLKGFWSAPLYIVNPSETLDLGRWTANEFTSFDHKNLDSSIYYQNVYTYILIESKLCKEQCTIAARVCLHMHLAVCQACTIYIYIHVYSVNFKRIVFVHSWLYKNRTIEEVI